MHRIRTSILGVAALAIVSLGGCRTATPLVDGDLLASAAPLSSTSAPIYGSGSDDDYGIPPQPALPMPSVGTVASPEVVAPIAPQPVATRTVVRTAARVEYAAPAPSGWASAYPEDESLPVEVIEDAPAGAPMADGEFAAPAPGEEGDFIEIIEEEPYVSNAPIAYEAPAFRQAAPARRAPLARPSRPRRRTYCETDMCDCFDKYLELHAEVHPGLGGGFTFGWRFHKSCGLNIAWEVAAGYQDLWEEFVGEGLRGKYMYLNTGVKVEFGNPCDHITPFVRAGVSIFELSQIHGHPTSNGVPQGGGFPTNSEFQANVNSDLISFDRPGSNVGGYVSVGIDLRLSKTSQWTTGPEAGWFIGENLSVGGESNSSVYFRWNFSYNF